MFTEDIDNSNLSEYELGVSALKAMESFKSEVRFELPVTLDQKIETIKADVEAVEPDFIYIDGFEFFGHIMEPYQWFPRNQNFEVEFLEKMVPFQREMNIPFIFTKVADPYLDLQGGAKKPQIAHCVPLSMEYAYDLVMSFYRPFIISIEEDENGNLTRNNQKDNIEIQVHKNRLAPLKNYHMQFDTETGILSKKN